MAVGSGLGGQVSVVAETTYGTYVAPTRHLVGNLNGIPKLNPNRVQGGGLYAGEAVERGGRYVETHRDASGSIEVEVSRKQFGIFLAHLLGSSAAPVQQAATTAYLQTHAVAADSLGKSMTLQAGVPTRGGTVQPYSFLGSVIKKAKFECGRGDILKATFDFDCRDMTEAQALVTASFPTGAEPFHFKEMAVKVGTFGAEASVSGVRKFTLEVERPLDTDAFYAGAAGLKSAPVTSGPVKISGSIETDFVDKTVFVDRFIANTSTSLVWEFVGPIIASTFANTVRFTMPMTFFTGDTPPLDGPEVVGVTIPFEAKFDLTNPALTAAYMSTDTTV